DAVTLWFAKKKGTNAVNVAEEIILEAKRLKSEILPLDVEMTVTRDYGETANDKVNELLFELVIAIVTVVALVTFGLGWRSALIVALSVPVSFALALFSGFLLGYTINRVTLFALVLALGLVVDDPIANVDNIQRHLGIRKKDYPARFAALDAVSEIFMPVLGATLAVVFSFLPMFFITGMMGPYMAPMAANVPLAMLFSLLCSITIVPWLAFLLLRNWVKPEHDVETAGVSGGVFLFYRRVLEPFLDSRRKRWILLGGVGALLVVSGLLAVLVVPLKMLPFDNKNEFQLVVDMPEGTTLETTDAVVRQFEQYLAGVPEIDNYSSFVGTASPMDFNGMVRHYYMRTGSNMADIRVNLVPKKRRSSQSHSIALRIRKDLARIAEESGAFLKVVEAPPGPPVISTLTVEIYGSSETPYAKLIEASKTVESAMRAEESVVDIDDTSETPRTRLHFEIDREKAALQGIQPPQIVQTLFIALSGATPANVHVAFERHPLRVRVLLPRSERSSIEDLGRIALMTPSGKMLQLAQVGRFVEVQEDQPIYHKNLVPVVYVFGEMAGRSPVNAILSLQASVGGPESGRKFILPAGVTPVWSGEGEWKITVDVFRDLGIAFAAAMMAIYIILVLEVKSFRMPLVIMSAIPLTAIGIMPGFALLNLFGGGTSGGYSDGIFFTATAMIGMIALGGIVVRNSILLIEFVRDALSEGLDLKEALLRSGGVRFRPIVLTAAAAALGAWPITLDPIFSGLAWALIFGLVASTSFTLLVVPVLYYMIFASEHASDLAHCPSVVQSVPIGEIHSEGKQQVPAEDGGKNAR
ncbi:MAG: efflux RND transporter permease subunit, partial [Candidatus Brocadiia bacterium]